MGCGQSSSRKEVDQPQESAVSPSQHNKVAVQPINPKDFHVSAGDFVKSKTTKFRDEYDIKNRLGEGAYGEVRKVVHKASGLVRAVKIMKKEALDEEERSKMISELQILTTLDHPNIMKVYEMFEEKDKYYIVSEFLEGGELFDKLIQNDRLSEREAAKVMKQVLSAVSYSHQHHIVHRDLKPENLVYDTKSPDANLKVIDFGTATVFKPNVEMEEIFGTALYVAPEVLTTTYTEKCDIWSCGVILYLLLSGTPPFQGKNEKDTLQKVAEGRYDFSNKKLWGNITPEAKAFISRMMELDPQRRYSAEQALQDPWIKAATSGQGKFDEPIAAENLRNLQSFGFRTKFQEAAWIFLVSFFSTKNEKQQLLETFKALDQNGDGQLTKEELKQGYVKIMHLSNEAAEEEAEKVMNTIDINKSGKIDYSEFVNATISRQNLLTKEKLEAAFNLFDKNKDGRISGDEMRLLFNEGRACGLPPEIWNEWIGQVDKNGDGGISLEEFKEMMMSLITKT